MSKGPLNYTDKGSVGYWAMQLYGKRYESLDDNQARNAQNALGEFLLEWQEEMDRLTGKGA